MVIRDRTIAADALAAGAERLRQSAGIPGLVLVVVDADGVLHASGHGHSDLATGRPVTPQTAFRWFSMTKVVTATAALRLADEGRIDLDAPVSAQHLGSARQRGRRPTTRELLSHTAGLGNPLPLRWVHPADVEGPGEEVMLARGAKAVGRRPPGGGARYTNVGYLVAGRVVAEAAGMSFESYVEEAVLQPAGMGDTAFAVPDGLEAATGYVRVPRVVDPVMRRLLPAGVVGARHRELLSLKPFYVDGPSYGGLVGSVLDVGRFLRLHLRDGELDGERVLTGASARLMRAVDRPGRPFDHGLGWFRSPRRGAGGSGDWVEHFGAGVGFWNVMRLYPRQGLGVAVMANTTTRSDFEPLFADVVARCGRSHRRD